MSDAVSQLFTCVDYVKKKNECKLCGKILSGGHLRRMIYHLVPDVSDGSTKACAKSSEISAVQLAGIMACWERLNDDRKRRKDKRKRIEDSGAAVTKFQSTLKLKIKKEGFSKQETDLAFARMVVMSLCRSGFMDSYFTQHFFSHYMCYEAPSRRTVYRTLLNQLYKDTKEKVILQLNAHTVDLLCMWNVGHA